VLYLKVLGINYLKEKIADLLFRGDSYVVIEILNHYVQVTVLKVNLEKKKIRIIKNEIQLLQDFSIEAIFKAIRASVKKIRRLRKYQLIISLDSRFATTIYASVSLIRPHPKEVIDEADIDNLISQAIWKFFDRHRLRAAQKMAVDDLDVLLSDVRIRGIKIDGHQVVNPIGFKAKTVEISFSQTVLVREILRKIREQLPKSRTALIIESGTALAHLLHKLKEKDRFWVVNLFPDQSSIFSAANGRLAHLDDFGWGENNLSQALTKNFRVDLAVARSMIQEYLAENVSQSFLRKLETILIKELQMLANGLSVLAEEEKSDVYLNPYFPLPAVVFSNRFSGRLQKPLKLSPLSTNSIIQKLGYELEFKESVSVRNMLSLLAVVLELDVASRSDRISHLANRRVRWLIT